MLYTSQRVKYVVIWRYNIKIDQQKSYKTTKNGRPGTLETLCGKKNETEQEQKRAKRQNGNRKETT